MSSLGLSFTIDLVSYTLHPCPNISRDFLARYTRVIDWLYYRVSALQSHEQLPPPSAVVNMFIFHHSIFQHLCKKISPCHIGYFLLYDSQYSPCIFIICFIWPLTCLSLQCRFDFGSTNFSKFFSVLLFVLIFFSFQRFLFSLFSFHSKRCR